MTDATSEAHARAEIDKWVAEREKLIQEALKLQRERWWYPMALAIAASGATAAIIKVFS